MGHAGATRGWERVRWHRYLSGRLLPVIMGGGSLPPLSLSGSRLLALALTNNYYYFYCVLGTILWAKPLLIDRLKSMLVPAPSQSSSLGSGCQIHLYLVSHV